jgi:hypothetical protein
VLARNPDSRSVRRREQIISDAVLTPPWEIRRASPCAVSGRGYAPPADSAGAGGIIWMRQNYAGSARRSHPLRYRMGDSGMSAAIIGDRRDCGPPCWMTANLNFENLPPPFSQSRSIEYFAMLRRGS